MAKPAGRFEMLGPSKAAARVLRVLRLPKTCHAAVSKAAARAVYCLITKRRC